MTMNPNYEQIGKTFVQQYYAMFDADAAVRTGLANFYSDGNSLLTYEGQQIMGRQNIMEKLQRMGFQKIQHILTATDTQPTLDGGVLVVVLGQLKTDDDPLQTFNETFVLKPLNQSFYIEHHIFRLALHA
jgi:Nuclear transport factor 2 (NTF2) domain